MAVGVHEPGMTIVVTGIDHRGITPGSDGPISVMASPSMRTSASRWLPVTWLMLRTQPPLMSVLVMWVVPGCRPRAMNACPTPGACQAIPTAEASQSLFSEATHG